MLQMGPQKSVFGVLVYKKKKWLLNNKVKGQPIPHTDMHGCGYGMSDIYRCASILLGSHQKTNTVPNVTQAHPSMPSIPNIALFQTHKIKLNQINKTEQIHKKYYV